MPNHVRRQIRDAAVTAVTGLSTTGTRVYAARTYPLAASGQMPGLLVYTDSESSEAISMGGAATRRMQRQVLIQIEGIAKAVDTVENTIEDIAKEVEVAMMTDPTLGGLVKDLELTATAKGFSTVTSSTGDQPVGGIRLTYRATYHTRANAPDVAA